MHLSELFEAVAPPFNKFVFSPPIVAEETPINKIPDLQIPF